MKKEMTIQWKDLQVGDIFPCGSKVTEIMPWEEKETFMLMNSNNESIVVSEDHMFLCEMTNKVTGDYMNPLMSYSKKIRDEQGIKEEDWITAKDLWAYLDVCIVKIGKETTIKRIKKTGIKERVRCIKTNKGYYLINGFISHNSGGADLTPEQRARENAILNTLSGFSNSHVIQNMVAAETTEDARKACFEGLKEIYEENGINNDSYNYEIMAKAMTSYKRDETTGKLRLVKPGEKCDIVGMKAMGNYRNPLKAAQLETPYKTITKEVLNITIPKDSAIDITTLDL